MSGTNRSAVSAGFATFGAGDAVASADPLWAKPEAVAAIIKKAAQGRSPVVYAPGFWRWIMLAVRAVPAPVFHRTKL